MIKLFTAVAVVLSFIMYWATTNVCRYNFAIEKRTNILNILTEQIDPSIPKANVYYFKELNCNKVDLSWDYKRVIKNLKIMSVIIYQELNTDIRGNTN